MLEQNADHELQHSVFTNVQGLKFRLTMVRGAMTIIKMQNLHLYKNPTFTWNIQMLGDSLDPQKKHEVYTITWH